MILAGDVGGTKVHLALYGFDHGQLTHVRDERFPAHEFSGLEEIVTRFLKESGEPEITAACFGVPGPVRNGRLKLTNLPWTLDSRELSMHLNIAHLFLINDLEANGYGIPELSPDQIFTLNAGDASAVGNRALVSAGTGLGEGILVWNGKMHVPMASEGGHADFAPRNELEIDLLRWLMRRLNGRVSFERVVSGIGLKNIYTFLRDEKRMEEPEWLRDRMENEDPNAVIGELGEDGGNELCSKTLDIFVSAYGAEAGNMALKVLASGGIYLGGGIAPKILKKMKDGAFLHSFTDKGRLSDLLIHTPVRIILESRAALMGAAAFAEARAAETSGRSERAASR
ncbi:glucokinase [Paracidobacterium acidisoli]|uniref:Glucokinase n=1 Tax=Paracidobacterium acidisoli TaxID=2303751 RepID=A0A372IPG4_9BACT|nr:glucokinase [Paracidobacterium acidisoli]MBT9331079.1 glucokinase [Paracidobacterium acidisoli]